MQVRIEAHSPDLQAVTAVFEQQGFRADVRSTVMFSAHPGVSPDYLLITLVSLATGTFLSAFIAEAGKDAYKSLKAFVGKLAAARGAAKGRVLLHDPVQRLIIYLPADLPDEAYEQLFIADLSQLSPGTLVGYDPATRSWRAAGNTSFPKEGGSLMWFGADLSATIFDFPGSDAATSAATSKDRGDDPQ